MEYVIRLHNPIPDQVKEEFQKKLSYVSEALLSSSLDSKDAQLVRLNISDEPTVDVDKDALERSILSVAESLTANYRSFRPTTLYSNAGWGTVQDDPHQELIETGELISYGPGRYAFGSRTSHLFAALDEEIASYAKQIGAVVRNYPSLIAAKDLEKCRYLRSFPNSLCFVHHLREDLNVLRDFAATVTQEKDTAAFDRDFLSPPKCLLSPNVCFHCYSALSGLSTDRALITAVGRCFRYEARNLAGLDRLWEFNMREIVFLGEGTLAVAFREAGMKAMAELFSNWGLRFEITTATDPFFTDDFEKLAAFQVAFALKYELLTYLPYLDKSIAAGSFNYHQDFFGRAFGISLPTGAHAHSACIGFGLERLALAHFAQFGVEETFRRFGIS